MQLPSVVTDNDLRAAREQALAVYKTKTPRAWMIKQIIQDTHQKTLHESTIRGRFIEMGEPLRLNQESKVDELEKEAEVKNEVVVSMSKTSEILGDMKAYIPSDRDFVNYVERPSDAKLSIHYEIGASEGSGHKYPITQGKQGTGKTFSHAYYAWRNKLPFFLFSCYEDFRLQKLFGDKTIINGTVKFKESLFVKAIQNPCVILFDEINAISNANSFDFHALLQNRELFIKDADDGNGKTYKLHKECRIGFAQNPKSAKYIGGNIKPSNFLGRCTFITYPEFTKDEIEDAMRKRFPGVKQSDICKFVTFYFAAVKLIETNSLPLDVSIRQLTNMIDLWVHGLSIKDAIYDGLISMFDAISQPNAKDAVYKLAEGTWKELLPEGMNNNG